MAKLQNKELLKFVMWTTKWRLKYMIVKTTIKLIIAT